ncbi:hypothetical protein G3M81_23140 [Bacillus paralicheniformis]|uniref:hypothetical protein n=1 Tax=Bacillus TaxID=1386 RepID=UPI0013EE5340|nr:MULTISPECIES: hypothetical protein [Bacillus]QII26988.1 hypothetical protein G3M80_21050 [Bacillus altitudinis]QII51456.1 hypothetical protein G3M81_23140 [Bacillus paralicheniformis]
MIYFIDKGIKIVLTFSEKKGFSFYEEEPKNENECFIKPVITERRLRAYQNKDTAYFHKLYRKDKGIPLYDENKNLQYIMV